jgi:hypothetical protein
MFCSRPSAIVEEKGDTRDNNNILPGGQFQKYFTEKIKEICIDLFSVVTIVLCAVYRNYI